MKASTRRRLERERRLFQRESMEGRAGRRHVLVVESVRQTGHVFVSLAQGNPEYMAALLALCVGTGARVAGRAIESSADRTHQDIGRMLDDAGKAFWAIAGVSAAGGAAQDLATIFGKPRPPVAYQVDGGSAGSVSQSVTTGGFGGFGGLSGLGATGAGLVGATPALAGAAGLGSLLLPGVIGAAAGAGLAQAADPSATIAQKAVPTVAGAVAPYLGTVAGVGLGLVGLVNAAPVAGGGDRVPVGYIDGQAFYTVEAFQRAQADILAAQQRAAAPQPSREFLLANPEVARALRARF